MANAVYEKYLYQDQLIFVVESDSFVGIEKVKVVLNLKSSFALTHMPDS